MPRCRLAGERYRDVTDMAESDSGDGLAPNEQGTFSYWQVIKIRAALIDRARYGDGGRGISDAQLAGEISAWAELKAKADAKAAGGSEDTVSITIGKEAIRRFRNASYIDERSGRIKEPESIHWIAYYLTHPDVAALSVAELKRRKVPYVAPLRLVEFLDPDPVPIPERLNGVFRTEVRRGNLLFTKHVSLAVPVDGALMHVEEIENCFEIPVRGLPRFLRQDEKTGWGLLTPEDYIIVFMKNDRRPRNSYYFSFFQMDDFWAREDLDHLFVCEQSEVNEISDALAGLLRARTEDDAAEKREIRRQYQEFFQDITRSGFLVFDRSLDFSLQEREVLSNILDNIDVDAELDIGLPRTATAARTEALGTLLAALGTGKNTNETDGIVDERDRQRRGRSLLRAAETGDPARLRAALDAGAPINYADPRTGETALHIVAAGRARWALRVLMEHDDLLYCVRDRQGRLPSEIANMTPDAAMGRLLMMKEAAEARPNGIMPRRQGDMLLPTPEP